MRSAVRVMPPYQALQQSRSPWVEDSRPKSLRMCILSKGCRSRAAKLQLQGIQSTSEYLDWMFCLAQNTIGNSQEQIGAHQHTKQVPLWAWASPASDCPHNSISIAQSHFCMALEGNYSPIKSRCECSSEDPNSLFFYHFGSVGWIQWVDILRTFWSSAMPNVHFAELLSGRLGDLVCLAKILWPQY